MLTPYVRVRCVPLLTCLTQANTATHRYDQFVASLLFFLGHCIHFEVTADHSSLHMMHTCTEDSITAFMHQLSLAQTC